MDRNAPPIKRFALLGKLPLYSPHVERYKAHQAELDRDVEFRILSAQASEAQRKLFLLELEDLVNLDHKSFLPVVDSGKSRERPFYVSPLRPAAPNLWELTKTKELTGRQRFQIVRALAEAMASAHLAEIHLGPASPLTVVWSEEDATLRYIHHRFPKEVRTLPMPPHLPKDILDPSSPSARSDIFHWAYVSYWILTAGSLPFSSDGSLIPIRKVIPETAREIAHLLEGSLDHAPEKRPQTAQELTAYLDANPQNVAAVDPLKVSGTIPAEALRGNLDRLRKEGRIQESKQATQRIALQLKDSPFDLEGLSEQESSNLKRAVLTLLVLLFVGGGLAGLALRKVRTHLAAYKVKSIPMVKKKAPTPRPEEPQNVHILAPSTQAKFRNYAGIRRLLEKTNVDPNQFISLWKQLRTLALQSKLPPGLQDFSRIQGFRTQFRKDPSQACKALEKFFADLKEILGTPAPN